MNETQRSEAVKEKLFMLEEARKMLVTEDVNIGLKKFKRPTVLGISLELKHAHKFTRQ